MSPKIDFAFKLIFGDEKHKEITIAFLTAVLKVPKGELADIEIINSELLRQYEQDRKGILDVRVKTRDGRQIDIEIQILPTVFMPERTLFYWSKMYASQIRAGDGYELLKKCITINIVDFDCTPLKQVHSCYTANWHNFTFLIPHPNPPPLGEGVYEKRRLCQFAVYHLTEDINKGHRLTDVLEVHFLELPKLFEEGISIREDDAIVQWMLFIDGSSMEVMEMLAEKNKDIWSAYSLLKIISNDEKTRMVYEAREAELMDQRTRIKSAEEIGVKRGKAEIIQVLLARGMTVEDVASIAGMDISGVAEIQKGVLGHAENVKI